MGTSRFTRSTSVKYSRRIAAAFALAATSASAQTTVYNRGLPTANLNEASGPARSNVAWSFGTDFVQGDDFNLGPLEQGSWRVDKLTVWAVFGDPASSVTFGDRYSDIRLYLGTPAGGVTSASSGTVGVGVNTTSNADISIERVSYAGGAHYQSPFLNDIQVWKITFGNINWMLGPNQTAAFAVDAPPTDPMDNFVLHASNAANSGSTQTGADDLMLYWEKPNLNVAGTPWCSNTGNTVGAVTCETAWDKNSDYNVIVEASTVPEPSSYALMAVGLVAVGFAARRRREAIV